MNEHNYCNFKHDIERIYGSMSLMYLTIYDKNDLKLYFPIAYANSPILAIN